MVLLLGHRGSTPAVNVPKTRQRFTVIVHSSGSVVGKTREARADSLKSRISIHGTPKAFHTYDLLVCRSLLLTYHSPLTSIQCMVHLIRVRQGRSYQLYSNRFDFRSLSWLNPSIQVSHGELLACFAAHPSPSSPSPSRLPLLSPPRFLFLPTTPSIFSIVGSNES